MPSVRFSATSISVIGRLPIAPSISDSIMVARLSVIATESVTNPGC